MEPESYTAEAEKSAAPGKREQEKILKLARERMKLAVDAEAEWRTLAEDDLRFVNGDSDNGWQWPDYAKTSRGKDRPALTINKVRQFRHQIVNDIRQQQPSIKVRPVDTGADPDTAEVMAGLIRHIEDRSLAQVAYLNAVESAVDVGLGYCRVMSEYADAKSFNQELLIKPIDDRFSVRMDPDSIMPDGSDAKWCFIVTEMKREDFEAAYPKADLVNWKDEGNTSWCDSDSVVVAEYYHIDAETRELVALSNGSVGYADELPDEMPLGMDGLPLTVVRRRSAQVPVVKWCKLTGAEVLEQRTLPGEYLPVARCLGERSVVDGKVDFRGIVRNAKDPQRIYNFERTAITERNALAPKSPWLIAEGQVEGYEDAWATANTANHAYLPYRPTSIAGAAVPLPQRVPGPDLSPGMMASLQTAEHDLQSSVGMYSASLGERSNEKSGRAILARQREGDVATAHYSGNLAQMIRHVGRILIQWIPAYYDTARVARILGEDGSTEMVKLSPGLPQAAARVRDAQGKIQRIYNPTVGRYDVTAGVGPSYQTQRQEAAETMMGMVQAYPPLMQLGGDILVRNLDWPGAEQLADRLKSVLPPQIQALEKSDEGDGAMPPEVQAMQAQVMQAAQAIQQKGAELAQAQQAMQQEAAKIEAQKAELQALLAKLQAEDRVLKADASRIQAEIKLAASSVTQGAQQEAMGIVSKALEQQQALGVAVAQELAARDEAKEAEDEADDQQEAQKLAALLQGLQAIAGQVQTLAQQVAGQQVVDRRVVTGPDGRIVGGVIRHADGTEEQITIQ